METLTPPVPSRGVAIVVLLAGLAGCNPNAARPDAGHVPTAPETLLSRTQSDAAEAERRAALAIQQARDARARLEALAPAVRASQP